MILNYMIIVNTGILGHPLQNKYMCALKKISMWLYIIAAGRKPCIYIFRLFP